MHHIEVIFSDNHCLAVSKPARLNTAADRSGDESLIAKVKELHASERERAGKSAGYCVPIHFLDRPVSGVVLFATSSKAAARLNQMMKAHQFTKEYLAVVDAEVRAKSGVVDSVLVKDHKKNISREVGAHDQQEADGKPAKLSFEVLGRAAGKTLLLVRPKSGRSHQIRVQLSARGWPIWGDKKYGAREAWDSRIALHAWHLKFKHPIKADTCQLVAPLPEYWEDLWPNIHNLIKNLH